VNASLSSKIAALPTMNKAQLLDVWAKNFSQAPPPKMRKEIMVPILAYRMQEREFGGLSHTTRNRLREIAKSLGPEKPRNGGTSPDTETGTRLIRSWHGEVHEVVSVADGYQYRGQRYRSLSVIARKITGTRWSGPLFFGVRKKAS
jgi:hypothetical protein